ncbi:hypothetical protein A9P82_07095 [Arachidicoccus ginsenosidimutans]|uniref:FecR family protein n=1 Tax=Arachidicoccus sp. BS20 TaxID=1850526 RepID=UPI0007F1109B|nr:FecR family protein [Arachidicoccus sp. BS20]ANI89075.1 hypothetical protein A9P82_07095 [Arachidicoccus sp. BS20]
MTNDRFTELLTKYLCEQIGTDEYAELEYLISNDESLRDRFNYFKAFWKNNIATYNGSDALFAKIKSRIAEDQSGTVAGKPKKKFGKYYFRAAALLLLGMVCFGAYKIFSHTSSTQWVVKNVLAGDKSVISLADGTKVTLNAKSSFKYPAVFSGSTREVYLTGEAFFDVTHDAAHPFIVHTAKMNVRVLGTAFDVKAYKNDSVNETTLIRGMVEITLPDRPSDRIILKPKEKLTVNQASSERRENSSLSIDGNDLHKDTKYTVTSLTYFQKQDSTIVETSWLDNKFVFKDEDFPTLCNRLERRFGITINIENKTFRDYRFTGSFTKENIGEILDILSYTEPFHYKENNKTISIY